MHREIAALIETVKKRQRRQKSLTLLIGAGCSVGAGIPAAGQFIKVIEKWASALDEHARTKSGEEAEQLLKLAEEKIAVAEALAEKTGP